MFVPRPLDKERILVGLTMLLCPEVGQVSSSPYIEYIEKIAVSEDGRGWEEVPVNGGDGVESNFNGVGGTRTNAGASMVLQRIKK